MPRWQGQSKGTPLGYRIIVLVVTNFGLGPAYLLLRFVAFYYFLFSSASSKYIYAYFREQVGYASWRSRWKVYQNYNVFAQSLLDKTVVMAGIPNSFTFDFNGEEYLTSIVSEGRGGILLGAHVGNWEVAGHLLKRIKTRVNVVMYDGEHRNIKAYLDSVTGERNLNLIVIKEDLSHVYAIGEALQKNELVCLLSDRFIEGNKTVLKHFLNGEARFPDGPFALAAAFKVPVSVAFAFKGSTSHYHFYASAPMSRGEHQSKIDFKEDLMNRFIEQLEKKIKQYPEQWFNYYKFWE